MSEEIDEFEVLLCAYRAISKLDLNEIRDRWDDNVVKAEGPPQVIMNQSVRFYELLTLARQIQQTVSRQAQEQKVDGL